MSRRPWKAGNLLGNVAKIEAADVEAERLAIQAIVAELPDAGERLRYCLGRVFEEKVGAQGLVTRFLFAQLALSLHARHDLLSRAETAKLVAMAHRLLQLARIKPTSSRLAFLYADLYEALAEVHGAEGDRWAQIWDYQKAQLLSRKAPRRQRSEQIMTTAAGLFREGKGKVAHELVQQTSGEGPWLASLFRLRGEYATARVRQPNATPWDLAWTDAMEKRDPAVLFGLYRRERGVKTELPVVDLWLWSRAVAQTKAMDESGLPSVRQLRRGGVGKDRSDEAVFAAATAIEALYDSERPLEQRVDGSREILALAAKTATIERELLCLAALCRWLFRFNQMDLAICVLARYRDLAQGASGGVTDDPFGALTDLAVATLAGRYRRSEITLADERDFIVKQAPRILEIGKLATRISSLMMKGALKSWFKDTDSRDHLKVQTETEIAQTIVAFLTRRKGAFLKLGQICSYFDGPIARHVTEQYTVLRAEVAAMPPPMMRRVFQQELGKTPEEAFASFDELPFAAGSIGQVHRAVTKSGRRVAVKIRYENVRELIEVQLKTIRLGRVVFLRTLPALNWDEIMDEISKHLLAETDYEREREHMEFFAAHFGDDPDVVIPAVVPEFCSKGVLTTDFADGQSFEEFLAVASQEERDKAGETIARVLLTSNFALRRFNADPQPGNFLFEDGKVVFIDFGCVKVFDEGYFEQRRLCNIAFFRGDLDALGRAYMGQGYVENLDGVDLLHVRKMYAAVNAHALKDEPYRVIHGYGMNIFRAFSLENPHSAKFKLPADSFFSSRIEFGLMSVLHRLGARVNYRRILMPIFFPNGDAPAPLDEDSAA